MNKKKLFTILYVGLIIAVILFMIFIIFWLKGESTSCLKDPLQYYGEKIESQETDFKLCSNDVCYMCKEIFDVDFSFGINPQDP